MATMEYTCHAPTEQRWYKFKATRSHAEGPLHIVIEHENIGARKLAERQIRLQARLLASVEQAVIVTDLHGDIIYWNPFAEQLYGWSANEVLRRNIVDVTPAQPTQGKALQILSRLKAGESWSGEFLVRHRSGRIIPIHVTDSPLRDEDNQLIGIIGISTDMTEQKKTEQALRLSAMVYQAIGEAIMVVNIDGRIAAINPAFMQLTGYAETEVVGQYADVLKPDHDSHFFSDEIQQSLGKIGYWSGSIWIRHKGGDLSREWLRIDTIYDKHGADKLHVCMFSRITDQKRAKEMIWQQANFDALTGLPNRSMFHDRLEHEIQKAARTGQRLALMFIDLDQFKEVNDTLGHDIGDILLKEAAARLSACVRRIDTVARFGGDEFTVILGELEDTDIVERAARDIVQTLAEPFQVAQNRIHVSGSIGITLFPEDATDADALLKNADQAMYAAKNQGRNQFHYFTHRMQHAALARMRMINDLRDALTGHQFEVMYQPIVELATGAIHKAEALIRWRHPVRGPISPVEFIPVAEQTGMIMAIGEWVYHQALHQAKYWRTSIDPQFKVSVNMSPVQLRNPGIRSGAWFDQHHTSPQAPDQLDAAVIVEITEGLLLETSDIVTEKLQLFRDTGIQLSIDDFGTGYSALSYLRKFHVDYLKIDQTFVRKLSVDSDDLAMCEAIIVLAHKLGIQVIAEGIETRDQRDLLAEVGCDYGQGYLFSHPLSADDMGRVLRAGGLS
ncbi:MAG TPA: EAL domain-containing protein [Burkholderiaceae bacterium]|nr:EAL domain-containing protein [Burkholderiaceae bacterium]